MRELDVPERLTPAVPREPAPAFASQLPEPANLWIRYLPRSGRRGRGWPHPAGPWLDLAAGEIGPWEPAEAAGLPPLGSEPLDDVLYLPPVVAAAAPERDRLAGMHLARGTPVLVQLLPGQPAPPAGAVAVVDLLPLLAAGGIEALPRHLELLPPGAAAVWPLVAGVSDRPELWRRGVELIARTGVRVVQAVTPRLAPADRRRLVELVGDDSFDAVFHLPPPPERIFAATAHRAGLAPFLPRPLPRPPVRRIDNRRLAGLLALAAELWHRLERPREAGQALFRAAREIDRLPYELAALAREGNLGVLPWLDENGRRLVEEALAGGEPVLVAELSAEYLEG